MAESLHHFVMLFAVLHKLLSPVDVVSPLLKALFVDHCNPRLVEHSDSKTRTDVRRTLVELQHVRCYAPCHR